MFSVFFRNANKNEPAEFEKSKIEDQSGEIKSPIRQAERIAEIFLFIEIELNFHDDERKRKIRCRLDMQKALNSNRNSFFRCLMECLCLSGSMRTHCGKTVERYDTQKIFKFNGLVLFNVFLLHFSEVTC